MQDKIKEAISWRKRLVGEWIEEEILGLKWICDRARLPLTMDHHYLYRVLHQHYRKVLGEYPRLVHCRDFNDKIQWLKLFDQSELIATCCDKLGVRDYVASTIGKKYLVELYGVADTYGELNVDLLPHRFVIKTNHDSGTVILVRDKSCMDHASASFRVNQSLKRRFGCEKGEWGYDHIKPKVFAEEYIGPDSAIPPPDYKFHCVDGRVRFLHYIYDRGGDTRELFISREGKLCDFCVYFPKGDPARYAKPPAWDELIDLAERLSRGFKYVRVDFFVSQGRIYAGEMTFWPMAGCYKEPGQKVLGDALDFDRTSVKPCIYHPKALPQ